MTLRIFEKKLDLTCLREFEFSEKKDGDSSKIGALIMRNWDERERDRGGNLLQRAYTKVSSDSWVIRTSIFSHSSEAPICKKDGAGGQRYLHP